MDMTSGTSWVCVTAVLVIWTRLVIGCTISIRGSTTFAVKRNGVCYTYADKMLTCDAANEFCSHLGSTLVTLTSPELQQFLVEEVARRYIQHAEEANFWISIGDLRGFPAKSRNLLDRRNRDGCLYTQGPDGINEAMLNDALFLDGVYCESEISTTTTTTKLTTTTATTTTEKIPTTATSLATTTSPTIATGPVSTNPTSTPENTTADIQGTTAPSTSEPIPTSVTQRRPKKKPKRPDASMTRRTSFFRVLFGFDAYLTRKEEKTVTTYSVISCCSKCLLHRDCALINFNKTKSQCRLFFGASFLKEEVKKITGWMLMSRVYA